MCISFDLLIDSIVDNLSTVGFKVSYSPDILFFPRGYPLWIVENFVKNTIFYLLICLHSGKIYDSEKITPTLSMGGDVRGC